MVPEGQRGTASGYYGLSNLLGILAGTVGAGLLQSHLGRGAAIASIAVLLLVTMLATVVLVPDRVQPSRTAFSGGGQAVVATFTAPLPYPDFMWLMGSRLLILMGIVGIQSFTLFFYSDAFFHHDSRAAVSATTVLLGLVIGLAILTTWPAARLSDRIGRKPLILAGGALGATGTLILMFSGYRWLPGPLLLPMSVALGVPPLAAQTMVVGLLIGVGFGRVIV